MSKETRFSCCMAAERDMHTFINSRLWCAATSPKCSLKMDSDLMLMIYADSWGTLEALQRPHQLKNDLVHQTNTYKHISGDYLKTD